MCGNLSIKKTQAAFVTSHQLKVWD